VKSAPAERWAKVRTLFNFPIPEAKFIFSFGLVGSFKSCSFIKEANPAFAVFQYQAPTQSRFPLPFLPLPAVRGCKSTNLF
jgi:hypothetical protein